MGDEPKTDVATKGSDPASDATAVREDGATPYRVTLPVFEGPLDLLLHLIQQHELDIFDIPIAFITQKYFEYVTLMENLNIDVASEYLVMAATLTHIKSKMLLPASPEDDEDEEDSDIDPRAELVRRLLEYQKYKEAAAELSDRAMLGRDIFMRGAPAPSVDGPAPLAPLGLFKLLDAFQAVLKRAKQSADHLIDVDRFSISDRINELSDLLKGRGRVRFEELFSEDQTRGDLIVTFLALLEMTRVRLIRIMQDGPLAPISIELAVTDDDESADDLAGEGRVGRPARAAEPPDVGLLGRSALERAGEGEPLPGEAATEPDFGSADAERDEEAELTGDAELAGDAELTGDADDEAELTGDTELTGDAGASQAADPGDDETEAH